MVKNVETILNETRLKLSDNIRRLRKNQELTQEELAHRAKLALRHLQKIEAGEVNVTLDTLVKLSYALNIDLIGLLSEPSQEGK